MATAHGTMAASCHGSKPRRAGSIITYHRYSLLTRCDDTATICYDTAKGLTVMSPQGRQCPHNDSSVYGEARPASHRGSSGLAWSSSCHEAGETSQNELVSVFCSH